MEAAVSQQALHRTLGGFRDREFHPGITGVSPQGPDDLQGLHDAGPLHPVGAPPPEDLPGTESVSSSAGSR